MLKSLPSLRVGWLALLRHLPVKRPNRECLDNQIRAVSLIGSAWLERVRRESRLYVELPDYVVSLLQRNAPRSVEGTLASANTVLRHRFKLLGSGDYHPVDPERPARNDYYPIDWYLDPVSGLRFPQGIPYKEWDLQRMRPGSADIKLPWELARCQHWPLLGQAWRLTGDSRYALEIIRQLDDFMQANPVGVGINWTCTMDVALRALNWAIGLALIKNCAELDDESLASAYRHLFDHGTFIFGNLENKYEVTSNHFLSNVVGLYYLASVFRELPSATMWDSFCRESLEREIETQVLEDGADYESSIPYHRLVTELFLGAARLAAFRKEPLSPRYLQRLRRMVNFLSAVLRPDGLMPQVGDADDGRLHILSEYGSWRPQDPRHLFGPAALVLEERNWLPHAGPNGYWESAWWGLDAENAEFGDCRLPSTAAFFPDAGLAITRSEDAYLLITNGVVGTKGFGNHKHNDQLSFELHLYRTPLIVDPGSFVYTSNPDARNQFRRTAYHNTLCVDGEEQNVLRPEWLFRLFETSNAKTISFLDESGSTEYRGCHVGYSRLCRGGVTHERRFRFILGSRLLIEDILNGGGTHDLSWHFHVAPGVSITRTGKGMFRLETGGKRFILASLDRTAASILDAWYSPSYGVREHCNAVVFSLTSTIEGRCSWKFAIAPEESFDPVAIQAGFPPLPDGRPAQG